MPVEHARREEAHAQALQDVDRFARLVLPAAFATACGGGGCDGEVTPPPAQLVSLAVTGVPFLAMTPGQTAQLTAATLIKAMQT